MPDRRSLCFVLATVLAWPTTVLAAAQPEATAPAPAAAPAPVSAPEAPAASEAAPTSEAAPAPAPAPDGAASTTASPPSPAALPACPPPPRPVANVRKGTPLIAAGVSITAGTYLLTALFGSIAIDKARKSATSDNPLTPDNEARPTDRARKRGKAMMIPIAGPFVAMRHTDSVARRYGLALNGAIQITGVVLTLVGAVQQSRYRQAKRWGLVAASGPDGAHVAVDVRF